jgi:hypothetical protein
MRRILCVLLAGTMIAGAQTMSLRRDETIIFYPGIAQRVAGKDAWRVEIRGMVFEPENRGISLWALREAFDLRDIELSAAEQRVFEQRARYFLVDHERRKRVTVRFGLKYHNVGRSRTDGSFDGTITLKGDDAGGSMVDGAPPRLIFEAGLALGSDRRFEGQAFALGETGLSVVSDIDDTIKITEVRNREATLRNTFLRKFQPAPGMAEFYQRLARERGAQFHYVSASPWQLYEPLSDFVRSNGFPAGMFALKEFRWKNRTALNLFADPEKFKPTVIEPLLKRFPKRRFILVGDSGERDPEIYGALARKFPDQIERIYIRDVTNESADIDRYTKAFRNLRREVWTIFREPSEFKFASK